MRNNDLTCKLDQNLQMNPTALLAGPSTALELSSDSRLSPFPAVKKEKLNRHGPLASQQSFAWGWNVTLLVFMGVQKGL
jgi:hypothetical protein